MVIQLAILLHVSIYKQGMAIQPIDTPTRKYKTGWYVRIELAEVKTVIPILGDSSRLLSTRRKILSACSRLLLLRISDHNSYGHN